MTERVLTILRRHGKRISCIFDGEIFENMSSKKIEELLEHIKEIGSIRIAKAIFNKQLPPEKHNLFIDRGITPLIISSDQDIHMALEALESVYFQNIEVLAVGVNDEKLLPVLVRAREKLEIMIIGETEEKIKSYLPYSDFMVLISDI